MVDSSDFGHALSVLIVMLERSDSVLVDLKIQNWEQSPDLVVDAPVLEA